MTTDTREALAALMVIAAECAQRKPLRGFEELTDATHIGHRQFGRAHEQADEAVRMLAVRLRAIFDTLAAALATQPAQPSDELLRLRAEAEALRKDKATLMENLEQMLRQFTKTPSSYKDSDTRCKAHAAIAATKEQQA